MVLNPVENTLLGIFLPQLFLSYSPGIILVLILNTAKEYQIVSYFAT